MRFASALIAVKDMKVSRDFYEGLLGLRVEFDFGKNLSFEGGLALQESFAQLIGMQPDAVIWRANNGELYFEEEDLDCAGREPGMRVYLDRGRKQDYGRFWAAIFALKNAVGISKHLQECFWYNGNEKENLITEFMRN